MRSSSGFRENASSSAEASLRSSSNFHQLVFPPVVAAEKNISRQSNVCDLLLKREISPQTKRAPDRFWRKPSSQHSSVGISVDARQELRSWGEAESLHRLSAKYCPLLPPPRSTIAAAFSSDGKTLASTHGDHTVKIIDCRSGKCLRVLIGHRRTPWVVRFHPLYPEILASGSLDHEVRLWDAKTEECLGSRDFYRPIASIAFHALGEILAVASGHKLYIWHYNRRGEASSPAVILKTRRSIRAVHFHPHAAPFLLTAEINDLDSSDPSMTLATSTGYLQYPPPTIYLVNGHSACQSNSTNELPIMSVPYTSWTSVSGLDANSLSQRSDAEMRSDVSQQRGNSSGSVRLFTTKSPVREDAQNNSLTREISIHSSQAAVESMGTEVQNEERSNEYFQFGDLARWEVPFLQGWLVGQSHTLQRGIRSHNEVPNEELASNNLAGNPPVVPSINPNVSSFRFSRVPSSQNRSRSSARMVSGSSEIPAFNTIPRAQRNPEPYVSQIQTEVASSIAAATATAAELPCTVKLRIWFHDVKDPCKLLDSERCRLMIPHAVLCSEMGAHFSPCGKFLAVCVACIMPNMDTDRRFQSHRHNDNAVASTSPTRHPISAHQVMYELRIYSLEEATFGFILASRAIRAAHCLTSIQFSPTSEHLLLSYGRRHSSLLRSVVIDGDTAVPIYTVLEIYRASDMELVRVLPSAEDEVNVACFHPHVGGGFVYGTKGFNNEETSTPDDPIF